MKTIGWQPAAKPTLLFLHPSDEFYGADRSLYWMVRSLLDRVRPVVVLADDLPYSGDLSRRLRELEVDVVTIGLPVVRRRYLTPTAFPLWLWSTTVGVLRLLRLVRRLQAAGIVTNTTAVMVGPLVAALARRPHIWYVREIVPKPGWFLRVVRLLARLPRGGIVAVSASTGAWLGPIPGHRTLVVHNGVDVERRPSRLGREPVATHIGRINRWKGQQLFVAAAEAVHARLPAARFRLVGGPVPGDEAVASQLTEQIQMADPNGDWLQWVGEVASARDEIRHAWLVVVPSEQPDPFPNVVLEAMAEGRAVVATRIGGIPEMVEDGETGVLVSPGDQVGLEQVLVELLSRRSRAAQLGRSGHRRAVGVFSRSNSNIQWRMAIEQFFGIDGP